MANRNFKEKVLNLENGLVVLAGNVAINASAAVTATVGKGFAVTKTNTGEYTVTLSDVYTSLLSAQVTVKAATAVDLVAQVVSYDVTSAKTVVIKVLAAAVATNPSAACEIHIALYLKNSSV